MSVRAVDSILTARSPLSALRGVGPARAASLAAAGYRVAADLLFHLPHRYEDRRTTSRIAEIAAAGPHTFRGRLRAMTRIRVRRRGLSLVRGRLADGSGEIQVLWFNRPYLPNQVEEDREYALHGPVRAGSGGWELVNPSIEAVGGAMLSGAIVPFYPPIEGLGPALVRRLLGEILEALDPAAAVPEHLPGELLERRGLPRLGSALAFLHRPPAGADAEALNARATPAHLRLVYGELLELQLELGRLRGRELELPKEHAYRIDAPLRAKLGELTPFRLTGAQERVVAEILRDLAGRRPMLRLLQGDVGSGKTIVAALALVAAMESGLQGAFMAPTEILAGQHHRSLERLLGGRYRVALLTGSVDGAAARRRDLARGRVQLAVGTHALIQESVRFERLGLAIVDEQHRFGVAQRRLLQRKGDRPDLLVMTATPIPRSLALAVYGDLDFSVLDELPPGRMPVETRLEPERRREAVYAWLGRRLETGSQAYVVLPLIEESDKVRAASIEAQGERLRAALAEFSPAVLHGRTPPEERDAVMEGFAAGRMRVLIATTVVEVGLDVPRADVMVIESAERFGLAQLHQLRGRIGRGGEQSTCVALHGRLGEEAKRRLEVFASTTDGFEIAEADLRLRGPGDLLGTRQAGLPAFRVADLVAHARWLESARADAREILESPERLTAEELAPLLARVDRRAGSRAERFGGG